MTLFYNKKLKRFYTIELVINSLSLSRHAPYMLAFNIFATDRGIRVDNENINDFKPVAIL